MCAPWLRKGCELVGQKTEKGGRQVSRPQVPAVKGDFNCTSTWWKMQSIEFLKSVRDTF